MPKKFKGENTKAQETRARKAAAKEEAVQKKRQEEDDAYWKDDDKQASRKQERKAQRESKRVEQLERKLAAQQMLDEEDAELKNSSKGANATAKVTRAQIEETKAKEKREREKQTGAATAKDLPKGVQEAPLLEQNPNILELERRREGEVQARSVDEAIAVLGGATAKADLHPEKRMKAAYAAFEEHEMPRLKSENPNLRMSQLKQVLRKEWMKSPDNPMVQQLAEDHFP